MDFHPQNKLYLFTLNTETMVFTLMEYFQFNFLYYKLWGLFFPDWVKWGVIFGIIILILKIQV